jgi:hypothetical protein
MMIKAPLKTFDYTDYSNRVAVTKSKQLIGINQLRKPKYMKLSGNSPFNNVNPATKLLGKGARSVHRGTNPAKRSFHRV